MISWYTDCVCLLLQTQAVSDGGKCYLFTLKRTVLINLVICLQVGHPVHHVNHKNHFFVSVLVISNCHFYTELNFKLTSRGSSSSLSESLSRSGGPQSPDGPASRVVTWAVCFERLLEDHVGVRYFTVSFDALTAFTL